MPSVIADEILQHLIASGEQFDLEFKGEEENALTDDDLVESVVCLANGRGGTLLIGVEDDGRVTGAHPRHGTYTDPRRLEVLIATQTIPSCPVECTVTTLDGRDIIVVEIPDNRPVTATTAGVY